MVVLSNHCIGVRRGFAYICLEKKHEGILIGWMIVTLHKLSLALVLTLITALSLVPNVHAQGITAQTDKSTYNINEPITITIRNNGPNTVGITMWVYQDGNIVVSGHFLVDIPAWGQHVITEPTDQPGSYKIEYRAVDYTTNDVYWATVQFQVKAQAPGPAFDFSITLSPPSTTVKQGETANYQILLTYNDPSYYGTTVTIQIMGLDPSMNYQLATSGGLSIYTSSTTPAKSYTITAIGSAQGVMHQTSATLIVTSQQTMATTSAMPFDFSVTMTPSTQTVEIGKTVQYSIVVSLVTGDAVPVSLSVEGLPSDIQRSFTMQTGTPPYSSTLNVDLSTSTSVGTYTITVVAIGAGKTKMATANLVIKEEAEQPQTTALTTNVQITTVTIEPEESSLTSILSNPTTMILGALAVVAIVAITALARRKRPPAPYVPQAPTRYCANCGSALKPGSTFCSSCGERAQ